MIKLKLKLSLFNLLSKMAFTGLFLLLMPYTIERINLRQVDNELIQKREQVISLVARIGIEPFIASDSSDAFGSYNILKEEFISIERISPNMEMNFIEVASRMIEGEEIDYRVLNYSFKIENQSYLLEIGKSLLSIRKMEINIKKVMWIFLSFIIIITFLTDLQYTRILLKPLDKITNKLKHITEPSKFDDTPVKTSTTDFLHLDTSLRELMERINILFQQEKEITVNISHELLTPISVLRSKLENLLLLENLDPDIAPRIEESLKTLHRLQSLVNSLLMIARIESHQYLRGESVSLRDILTEITEEIRPVADDSGVELKNEVKNDYQFTNANRSLIFSMFYNVVVNALKNTSAGGTVIVKNSLSENSCLIEISDTGKGMNEEQLKTLFFRFKSWSPGNGYGTGIGLAIAKSIADFHGIKVAVDSKVGKGTNFSFIF